MLLLQVSKCSFHKYGPSGTIEAYDALCVLPLNIINEKVNIFYKILYCVLSLVDQEAIQRV